MSRDSALTYPCGGRELLERMTRDRQHLSPTMRVIADYCVRGHARLHHMRLEDVAAQCGTAPSSVVRFARLFGHKGYQDFKTAFLQGASLLDTPALWAERHAVRSPSPDFPATSPCPHLLSPLEEDLDALAELRTLITSEAFQQTLRWIQHRPWLALTYRGEFDRMIAIHWGNTLQRLGKQVSLSDGPQPWSGGMPTGLGLHIAIDLEQAHDAATHGAGSVSGPVVQVVATTRKVPKPPLRTPSPEGQVLSIAGEQLGQRLQKALSLVAAMEGGLRHR